MEPTEFGKVIKSLREDRGLTMRELDKRSGVSHSYISKMESGAKGIPSPEILKKLAGSLDVEYEELMIKAGHIPESEKNVIPTPAGRAFAEHIRRFVDILIGDSERDFYHRIQDEVLNRIGEILNKHDLNKPQKSIVFSDKDGFRDDIPKQVADMILEIDNAQFQWDVLQELQDIAHEFHIKWNSAYEVGARQPRPMKLENIIERENITFNDKPLEDRDREAILEMLKLMFRNHQ